MNIPLRQIIDKFSIHIDAVKGNYDTVHVKYLKPTSEVDEYTLDWISPLKKDVQKIAEASKARVIICSEEVAYNDILLSQNKVLIYTKDTKLLIIKIGNEFFVEKKNIKSFIHASAVVSKKATIGKDVSVGSGCFIGECSIGNSVIIHPNVVIYDGVTIGDGCVIHAGTVLGTDGFGCSRDKDGTLYTFPHFGKLIIGANVEIGANSQVARGALSDTLIGNGCKLIGNIFISHNCILEENILMTGDTMLGGSVRVGKNTTIYAKVMVRDQTTIGAGCTIGMGAVITKDIPSGETWYGNPARKIG